MIKNSTINHQLNHRTIRAFKSKTLTKEQLNILYSVASHTPTSMFMQQMSIMHITDPDKRTAIREVSKQPYVGANGDLFIFLVDLYRNQQIRHQKGKDDGRLHTADIFFQGVDDAIMAAQNVIVAAESMDLGVVPLGSIKNDPQKLIDILDLPKMTFPVLGLQIGIPDQQPQLKPRLPLKFTTFDNSYPRDVNIDDLKDYDQIVTTYYDLRDANRRVDSFTNQIAGPKLDQHYTKRDEIMKVLHQQGLCTDENIG
ncbi:NADPH-dependent oxidoreductase [Limosilactobacillus sp. STM2_1]|uniref:NADPH-dependent oxidoreductase n=1 Tax=Limosilactobacillus rudii TaxID=2759755 RepID=A0A7W3UM79_9LACO|nr:NADPH-dependent oxidoreductase [Limosilactobacillus rudii]MBB1080020.1 NADPH-dependent oxidoreductase [Limosilactobacillus rudii]MBB1098153.1 NADPH-dependent oxidoreductase [Limosilactobacillus rudii]MCD7135225.1 NADPH-dependent oxidoreductase [Limosilactobacillus rudii]